MARLSPSTILRKKRADFISISVLSTGKVVGINNKIKVLKRTAYGFRDK